MKIINHDKHVGNNVDAMRESVLCSNINHPNIVMTYKVSLQHYLSWDHMPVPSCKVDAEGLLGEAGMHAYLATGATTSVSRMHCW